VCAFLEDQADLLAPASVRRRLYAIRKAHRLLALPDPTWDEDINLTLRVLIRRSKADPFGMERIAFSSKRSADLIEAWLAWRGPNIPPLFCGIHQGKPINRPLGTTKVKLIIKEAAAAAGFTPEDVRAFSGHSLRVGAAQDLLCAGFDTAAIMRAGGWKSINVLGRYLEFAEHNVWGSEPRANCSNGDLLGTCVCVVVANDVILAEIGTGLHLNERHRQLSMIFKAMSLSDGDID
jgi:hypothetical protein